MKDQGVRFLTIQKKRIYNIIFAIYAEWHENKCMQATSITQYQMEIQIYFLLSNKKLYYILWSEILYILLFFQKLKWMHLP